MSGDCRSSESLPMNMSNGTQTTDLTKSLPKKRVDWVVPGNYALPRKVIVKSMEQIDSRECSDRPGMVTVATLEQVVDRFDRVFGNAHNDHRKEARSQQVAAVIDHLKRHTKRRRGEAVIQEGLVEWEQTSRIYELFSVDLNIFERIFFTVDVGESTSVLSKLCSFFLMGMIFLSIVSWMVSTLPKIGTATPDGCVVGPGQDCEPEVKSVFKSIEKVCVYVFTAEYLLRVCTVSRVRFSLLNEKFAEQVLTDAWTSSSSSRIARGLSRTFSRTSSFMEKSSQSVSQKEGLPRNLTLESSWKVMLKYVLSPSNLVDLLAILPYWMELISGNSEKGGGAGMLMVLRVLRLTRVFRVFKLGKYNEVFTLFSRVVSQSMSAFGLMLFFIIIGCCLFGTLMWFAESGYWYAEGHSRLLEIGIEGRGAFLRTTGSLDPDDYEESPFPSIIHSFWFVLVTITTVGYGDVSPSTFFGKIVGALTILSGIIVLAMPIGVLGANFSQEYYTVLDEKKRRILLKQQLDTLAAVEQEQDAALSETIFNDEGDQSFSAQEIEVNQINAVRQRILAEAELLDTRWSSAMPPVLYQPITSALRQFVGNLLSCTEELPRQKSRRQSSKARHSVPTASAKPSVPISCLGELDRLGVRVYAAVSSITAVDDLAEFGLKEAHAIRRQWAGFADRVWEYVAHSCTLESEHEAEGLLDLKAKLFADREGEETLSLLSPFEPPIEPIIVVPGDASSRPGPSMRSVESETVSGRWKGEDPAGFAGFAEADSAGGIAAPAPSGPLQEVSAPPGVVAEADEESWDEGCSVCSV